MNPKDNDMPEITVCSGHCAIQDTACWQTRGWETSRETLSFCMYMSEVVTTSEPAAYLKGFSRICKASKCRDISLVPTLLEFHRVSSVMASSNADNAVVQPALSQAVGYVVVVVIGLVIAFGMLRLFPSISEGVS